MTEYARSGDHEFADQPGLIYYWGRNNFRTDEDRAIGFAYTFMGTRIQCAQCHKHPFDIWTKEDFDQFKAFFNPQRINFSRNGADRKVYNELQKAIEKNEDLLKELGYLEKVKEGTRLSGGERRRLVEKAYQKGMTVPFPELVVQEPRLTDNQRRRAQQAKKQGREVNVPSQNARLLGDKVVDLAQIEDPRTALMDWLRYDEKQIFAKAFVNRVWANYFHRGIVEPTDDISLANPPSNQNLLDYLATGFVENGYDMKWLHREICRSETYQRSWRPNDTNIGDERNFSRAVHRRLPAEVAYDALLMATANDERSATYLTDLSSRGVSIPGVGRNRNNGPAYALSIFGRSTRESNCDCDRSAEASLLQVVFTRNDQEVYTMIDRRDGWMAQFDKSLRPDADDVRVQRRIESLEKRITGMERQLKRIRESGNEKQEAKLTAQIMAAQGQIKELRPEEPEKSDIDTASVVEELYLRTLSRFPSDDEVQIATAFIDDADDTTDGVRSLLWTLINTKEFIVNH